MKNYINNPVPGFNKGSRLPGELQATQSQKPKGEVSTDGVGGFAVYLEEAISLSADRQLNERLDAAERRATSALNADPEANLENQQKQLWDAALQLESVFLHQLVSSMQRTVPRDQGVLASGKAEEIFQSMLDEQWAELMAKGDTGLAKMLYEQLEKGLVEE
ncbi:MAG: hypothetical protein GX316_03320 [Firmicutes bacterium]|nr:hypothetical protein [Bacillota bacterium]